MSSELLPENEQFIREAVHTGLYQNRDQALNAAVHLLRRRQELAAYINEGIAELDTGKGIELADDDQLHRFFEEVKREARERHAARDSG